MKTIQSIFWYIIFCWVHFSSGMDSSLLQKFADRYTPQKHVVAFIENNKQKVMDLRSDQLRHTRGKAFGYTKECPDVYFKGTIIDRLINAERMRSCIEKYKLRHLKMVKKYIYNLDGTWIVIADYIKASNSYVEITLDEVKELYELAKRTGYWDWYFGHNWIRDQQGFLVCCDSEDGSFCKESSFRWVYNNYLYEDLSPSWNNMLCCSSIKRYAQEKKEEMKGFEGDITVIPLCQQTQYDDPELDFEEVKRLCIQNKK